MSISLKNRHLLTLLNHTQEEIYYLLSLSKKLKQAKKNRTEKMYLQGKNIALIFEKNSTRTRCAFEVAAYDQGAHVSFLDANSQIGNKESIKDTARVLGRMYDGIQYRGTMQNTVETLALYSGVPVFNGLTDAFHPTQMLADLLTMQEHCSKSLDQIKFAYVGDARNNIGRSLLLIAAKLGMNLRIAAPAYLWPETVFITQCQHIAKMTGASLFFTEDPNLAVQDVDFIHTDVWVSMGENDDAWDERITHMLPYQVNIALMQASHNPDVKFMHCLPALHNDETRITQKLIERYPFLAKGLEVTDAVFESSASIVFDQAENRLHTIKAVIVSSLSDEII